MFTFIKKNKKKISNGSIDRSNMKLKEIYRNHLLFFRH